MPVGARASSTQVSEPGSLNVDFRHTSCATTIEVHSDPCKDRYQHKDPYIFGDAVPFGPWTVETSAFRRYGKTGSVLR